MEGIRWWFSKDGMIEVAWRRIGFGVGSGGLGTIHFLQTKEPLHSSWFN
jgi:hypothetical protein